MNSIIRLSIVVTTTNGRLREIKTLLQSVLRQQSAPTFEVVVVTSIADAHLEKMLADWDLRFRYLFVGHKGLHEARNLGLREARGEITLVLEDDCVLEDSLVLKTHYDYHQDKPHVIGLGGRFNVSKRAGLFDQAYQLLLDLRLTRLRIDSIRTLTLPAGHSSFKTSLFQKHFAFDETIGFCENEIELNFAMLDAGYELHLIDALRIERRLRLGSWSFLRRSFLLGQYQAILDARGIAPHWKYQGARVSLTQALTTRGGRSLRVLRWLSRIHDFAFTAGRERMAIGRPALPGHLQIAKAFASALSRQIAQVRYSRRVTEVYHTLHFTSRP